MFNNLTVNTFTLQRMDNNSRSVCYRFKSMNRFKKENRYQIFLASDRTHPYKIQLKIHWFEQSNTLLHFINHHQTQVFYTKETTKHCSRMKII